MAKKTIKPTIKQKKAVELLAKGETNVGKAMREAGYSPASAKNPKHLTDSQGFKKLCKDYGLTEDLILKSLVDDIKAKPKNRVGELRLGAGILKMTGGEGGGVAVQINFNEDKDKYA